jgi:hypothetical protein
MIACSDHDFVVYGKIIAWLEESLRDSSGIKIGASC